MVIYRFPNQPLSNYFEYSSHLQMQLQQATQTIVLIAVQAARFPELIQSSSIFLNLTSTHNLFDCTVVIQLAALLSTTPFHRFNLMFCRII